MGRQIRESMLTADLPYYRVEIVAVYYYLRRPRHVI
jgi:hypothetical protein